MLEVDQDAVHVIGTKRAADAAFLPVGPKHEMLDDQLAASGEQIGEGLLARRRVEDIVLFDLHPRQRATLGVQSVALPGELLFLAQEVGTRRQPLFLRYDRM